jgi:hypothetical protein|eukprot:COSAG06_NODE_4926_length_3855_cov_8.957401_2_plen_97_part_00
MTGSVFNTDNPLAENQPASDDEEEVEGDSVRPPDNQPAPFFHTKRVSLLPCPMTHLSARGWLLTGNFAAGSNGVPWGVDAARCAAYRRGGPPVVHY